MFRGDNTEGAEGTPVDVGLGGGDSLARLEAATPRDQISFDQKQLNQSAFTEEDQYYINGLTKQVEVTFSEIEGVMTKKSNIVYRALKLHLKKKPETSAANSSTQS